MTQNKTKIFVIYHQPGEALNSEIFQSICVGPKKDDFSQDFLRDDVGENIAEKNKNYNELTAIFWVFRHINEFPDTQYFGFCHYRRLFCFEGLKRGAYVKKDIQPKLTGITNSKLEELFKDYDFIVPTPSKYKSVKQHFEKSHNKEDLPKLLKSIEKVAPEYLESANEYLDNKLEYLYNMFVFDKNTFIAYSNFIFKVIEDFLKDGNEDQRLYVSERLTGIFIWDLIKKGKLPLCLPILHIRSKSLKIAIRQVKKNFKENTDHGFIYKIKPLILCLLPRHLEQWFRRRKTK